MDHRLELAGNRLEAALDRYFEASCTLQKSCTEGRTIHLSQVSFLEKQLQLASQIEEKIQRARTTSGYVRNCSSAIVPIHGLSPDLLARIFYHLVATEECEPGLFVCRFGGLPKYPIYLSHVCTYWRRLAISLPCLWSHIDISPSLIGDGESFSRARTFLSRAGQLPLDLHIHRLCKDDNSRQPVDPTLRGFITPLVPRMQGLRCNIDRCWAFLDSHTQSFTQDFGASALSQFLNASAAPGTLDTLDISVSTRDAFYVKTTEHPQHERTLSLDITAQHLEDLLLSITVLKLTNVFPDWSSKAFYGLVDLRLRTFDESVIMHESQLVAILTYSPHLRVLELGINIKLADIPLAPVELYNLEALITHFSSYLRLGRFLRLLNPVSESLFLSLDAAYDDVGEEFDENIVYFLSRSNVTRLCVEQFYDFHIALTLANFAHTIKKLAMTPPPNDPWYFDDNPEPVQLRLDTLYLLENFELDISGLRGVADRTGVQKLAIWGPGHQITRNGRPITSKQFLEKELSDLGITVEILSVDLPSPLHSFLL